MADWEWGLGYNTQLSGGFVKGEWTWVSGKAYSFTLSYDGQGNGTYTVSDNGSVLLSKAYTGSPGKLLRTGNALQAWVKTSPNIGLGAKVKLTVNSINGTVLNRTIQTLGNNLESFDAVTVEGQNLTTGFSLTGTVTLTFSGTIPYGSRLNFAITAGNTACTTQQQKQLGYVYSDHLDTPRLIHNAQGQALWIWDSDAFGTTTANENPSNLGTFNYNLRFPGQYYDQETKTHYNYFRDYDPATGRYIQSDPIGLGGGNNTYGYVGGNPVISIDTLGLWSTEAHNLILDRAFNGLSSFAIQAIKAGSAGADAAYNQLIGNPAVHAMRKPGESVESARQRACKFIDDRLKKYRQLMGSSRASVRYMAYFELGEAMHTIMDSTSPAHAGWQQWTAGDLLSSAGRNRISSHGDLRNSIEGARSLTPTLMQATLTRMSSILNGADCKCVLQ